MLADLQLLERFPLFHSRDVTEMQVQLSRYLCPHRLRVLTDATAQLQVGGVQFAGVRLLQLHYDAPVEVSLEGSGAHYLFRTTLQGCCEISQGQARASVGAGGLSISSPFASSRIVTGGACRTAVLSMPRETLELQLQRLLGRSLELPLAFDVPLGAEHPGVHALGLALDYLCRLHAMELCLAPMRQGLADHLVQLLLTQLPHNYSRVLQQASVPPCPAMYARHAIISKRTWISRWRCPPCAHLPACRCGPCKMASASFWSSHRSITSGIGACWPCNAHCSAAKAA